MNTPTTNYAAGALAEADNSASCLIARAVESQALRRDWKDLVNDNIATFEKALAHVSDAASQKHVLTLQLNDITAGASQLVASRAEHDNTVLALIASVKAAQAQRIAGTKVSLGIPLLSLNSSRKLPKLTVTPTDDFTTEPLPELRYAPSFWQYLDSLEQSCLKLSRGSESLLKQKLRISRP